MLILEHRLQIPHLGYARLKQLCFSVIHKHINIYTVIDQCPNIERIKLEEATYSDLITNSNNQNIHKLTNIEKFLLKMKRRIKEGYPDQR